MAIRPRKHHTKTFNTTEIMKKLIGMTDFVIKHIYEDGYDITILNYANFLKQPLTLGMFIPTDENGNVLEEPNGIDRAVETEYFKEYQNAKSNVLFENCVIQKQGQETLVLFDGKPIWVEWNKSKTIEDLIPYNLTLTDNKI